MEISEASLLKRRLLSGGAWALGGRIALALTGLVTSALLGRLLSPRDLGIFFLTFSVVRFCSVLGSLGLSQVALRFVAESLGFGRPGRARNVLSRILIIGAISTSTVGAIFFLFGGPLVASLFRTPSLTTVVGLVAGWIFATSFQTLLGDVFRGFHDIRLFAIFGKSVAGFGSLMTGVLLTAGLAMLWVIGGNADLVTVMFFAVGSSLISVLLAGWLLGAKMKGLPSEEEPESSIGYKQVLGVAWPLLVSDITLVTLAQASFWIVGAFRPEDEVAVFGAATRLIALVVMPLLIVNTVVSPLVAESYAQGKTDTLQKMLRLTATIAGLPALVVLLSFIFFGGPILGIVFGDYYSQGALILLALGLGNLVNVWVGSSGVTMAMTGHQKPAMVITVITGAITIAAGLISVNHYGALGVAVSAAAGMALQNVSMWLGVRLTTGMWTHMALGSLPTIIKALRAN